jgi:hypothetical protein
VGQANRDKRVTLECCAKAKKFRTVILSYGSQSKAIYDLEVFDGSLKPKWCTRTLPQLAAENFSEIVEVDFCPHCGTPVPEIEPRVTDKKISRYSDGGYYCDTCKERLSSCSCLPTIFCWQIKAKQE